MSGIRTLSPPWYMISKVLEHFTSSPSLLYPEHWIYNFSPRGMSTHSTLVFLHTKFGFLWKREMIERPVVIQKSPPEGILMVLAAGLPFFSPSSLQHLLHAANLTTCKQIGSGRKNGSTDRGHLPVHKGCAIMFFPVVAVWTRGYRILFKVAKQGINWEGWNKDHRREVGHEVLETKRCT